MHTKKIKTNTKHYLDRTDQEAGGGNKYVGVQRKSLLQLVHLAAFQNKLCGCFF